jgi:hypothetical protein
VLFREGQQFNAQLLTFAADEIMCGKQRENVIGNICQIHEKNM